MSKNHTYIFYVILAQNNVGLTAYVKFLDLLNAQLIREFLNVTNNVKLCFLS